MDTQQFAAERAARLEAADKEIMPFVEQALINFGRSTAWDDVVTGASVLWLETYEKELKVDLDEAERDGNLADFQRVLRESLEKTSRPSEPPVRAEIDRVAMWVGTFTVNDATWRALGAGGVRTMRWVTMHDNAVREMHRAADGQVRGVNGTFNVGGFRLHFPGEPVGPPEVWINCRCLVAPGTIRRSMSMAIAEPEVVEEVELPEDPDEETEVEDEDLVDDAPDDVPWHAVLAPEGVPTGDGRMFADGALSTRDLPLPITYQYESAEGHLKAVVVGRMDEAWRDDETGTYRARGVFWMNEPMAHKAIDGIAQGFLRGLSVDVDDVEVEQSDDIESQLEAMLDPGSVTVFSKARIAGAAIVHIPAFAEAYIALGPDFEEDVELEPEEVEALTACGCIDGVTYGPEDDDNPDIELGYDAFKDYSAEERKKMAEDGRAMPDGSFPIADEEDLKNAIQAIGRASDPEAAKRHIKKRASALGKSDLIPEGWSAMNVVDYAAGYTVHQNTYTAGNIGTFTTNPGLYTFSPRINTTASASGKLVIPEEFAPGTKDGPGWITHPRATARIRRYWVRGKGAAKIKWGVPGDFNRCRRQLSKYVQRPDWLAGLCANMHKEALGFWPAQHRGKHSLTASAGTPAPIFTLVASGAPVEARYFKRQEVDGPVGIVIEDDGHIYGYIATWNVCHIGIPGKCEKAPHSPSNYAYYRTGTVLTDEGPVAVGSITMGTGHADGDANGRVAAAHYDNTGAVVADIATGEDTIGIWFSGKLRDNVTDEAKHALAAAGRLSGDWRWIGSGLELVAALAVNVPGFPIPQPALVASAGEVTTVIGFGIVEPTESLVASALDAPTIAAIARTAVEEYIDQTEKRRVREERLAALAPFKEQARQAAITRLREKIK